MIKMEQKAELQHENRDSITVKRNAKEAVNSLIEKSDKVEVDLIDIKRLLDKADYCFEGIYIDNLAENVDIDAEADAYIAKL